MKLIHFRLGAPVIAACIFVVFASFSNAQLHRASPVGDDPSWNFLILVLRWPMSVCKAPRSSRAELSVSDTADGGDSCSIPQCVQDFTIHGLWPNFKDTEGPTFCTKVTYDPSAINPLRSELQCVWTDYYDATGDEFWSHEFVKHGSCALQESSQFASQLQYFEKTVDLAHKAGVLTMLQKAGVVPSSTKLYAISDFQKAVPGAVPTCLRTSTHANDAVYLTDIRFCVDMTLGFVPCEEDFYNAAIKTGGCPADALISFPPIQV
eukprot:ANDGO_03894.mRNA.1 Ribonuclease Oy